MIRLEKITEDNYRECMDLKVAENQTHFVNTNMRSLAAAYVYRDKVIPFAIYNDELMVGFIMIRFNPEYNNYFIWQFMIDERYQSRGYGKEAMMRIFDWIKKNGRSKEVVITYKEGNNIAGELYSKLGFQQLGEVEEGEVNMIIQLK